MFSYVSLEILGGVFVHLYSGLFRDNTDTCAAAPAANGPTVGGTIPVHGHSH